MYNLILLTFLVFLVSKTLSDLQNDQSLSLEDYENSNTYEDTDSYEDLVFTDDNEESDDENEELRIRPPNCFESCAHLHGFARMYCVMKCLRHNNKLPILTPIRKDDDDNDWMLEDESLDSLLDFDEYDEDDEDDVEEESDEDLRWGRPVPGRPIRPIRPIRPFPRDDYFRCWLRCRFLGGLARRVCIAKCLKTAISLPGPKDDEDEDDDQRFDDIMDEEEYQQDESYGFDEEEKHPSSATVSAASCNDGVRIHQGRGTLTHEKGWHKGGSAPFAGEEHVTVSYYNSQGTLRRCHVFDLHPPKNSNCYFTTCTNGA